MMLLQYAGGSILSPAMKLPLTTLLAGISITLLGSLQGATVIDFNNPTSFNAQFPLASRFFSGASSSASLVPGATPDQLQLHAQGDGVQTSNAYAAIYSTSISDLNFLSSSVTVTFKSINVTYTSGATYESAFGVFGQAGGSNGRPASSAGPSDSIYVNINYYSATLSIIQKSDGGSHTLASWTMSGSYSLTSAALTLSSSGWSFLASNGISTFNNANATGSNIGTFAVTPTTSNWGSNFYLGLYDGVTINPSTRALDLNVDSITVVPEPGVTTLLIMGSLLLIGFVRARPLVRRVI